MINSWLKLFCFLKKIYPMIIFQSKADTNTYHSLTLENGIKVLLVINDLFTKASCSLSVNIGSYDEPESFNGLAHFLEHMLFMGTEKYPEVNMFMEYLNQHNGSTNAYTAHEHTTYYCDIDSEYLGTMADMFSQFFISPLFKADTVDKEINAVNSEYLNSLNSKAFRLEALCKNFIKKGNPEGRFNCGNSETLRQENGLEEVINLWKTKYSSNLMSLVICGSGNVENLIKIANLFSFIKNNNVIKNPDPNFSIDLFESEYLSKTICFKPIDDKYQLIIVNVLPGLLNKFKCNPLGYIQHILTRSEEGSLLCLLKNNELAFSISFECDLLINLTNVKISVGLTKKGYEDQDKVLSIISSYLSSIRANKSEYEILRKLQNEDFDYEQIKNPIDIAEFASSNLLYYPVEYVLKHEHTFEEFDEELINNCIFNISNFKNWLVLLSVPGKSFDSKEKYYNVEYEISSSPIEIKDFDIKHNLTENDFNGNAIKIIQSENRYLKREKYENGEINLVFDSKFGVPKAVIYITLSSEDIKMNVMHYELYFDILSDIFIEKYDRILLNAHINISSYISKNSVVIKLSGFSSQMASIAKLFMEFINSSPDISDSRFEILKQNLMADISTTISKSPFRRLINMFYNKISSSLTAEECLDQIKNLTKDQLNVDKNFYCSILAVGNIELSDLIVVYKSVMSNNNNPVVKFDDSVKDIEFKTNDEFNNAIAMFYKVNDLRSESDFGYHIELDEIDIKSDAHINDYDYNSAIGHFINQIAKERFFNELRTLEQLGYIVYSTFCSFLSANYLAFIVQSEKPVDFLEERIVRFVEELKVYIKEMDEDEFETYRESVIGSYEEPIVNLDDLSKFVNNQFLAGFIDLNYNLKMVNVVKSLKREDLLNSSILNNGFIKVNSVKNK